MAGMNECFIPKSDSAYLRLQFPSN